MSFIIIEKELLKKLSELYSRKEVKLPLDDKQTINYYGGATGVGAIILISGIITFLLGLWQGISTTKASYER